MQTQHLQGFSEEKRQAGSKRHPKEGLGEDGENIGHSGSGQYKNQARARSISISCISPAGIFHVLAV